MIAVPAECEIQELVLSRLDLVMIVSGLFKYELDTTFSLSQKLK